MLNITSAETLFSGIGISIVALGFLCCLLKSRIRFGILSILLGNFFLWSAIVFPKKATDFMYQYGVDSSLFDKNELYHGLAVGVVIFVVWYFVRSAYVSLLSKVFKKDTANKTKEQSQAKSQDEISKAKDVAEPEVEIKELKTEDKAKSKLDKNTNEKIEPVFGSDEKADPHLFDNLKLNK